jgi:excisionase family DNA binding protein
VHNHVAGDTGRFLSIQQAAVYSSLSRDTIHRMLRDGRLTRLRPVPGRVLVDREQLDALVLGSAAPATAISEENKE